MKATNVLLGAASYLVAAQLLAGEAVFYITEEGSAVRDLAVSVNGQKKLVGSSGFVTFDIGAGNYRVELSKYGEYLGEFDFSANSNKENAEIQVELIGGEAMADVNLYVPGQEATPALGQLSGFIQSDETGGGVAGASVVVNGTELAIVTDEKGYFSLELPRGDYSLVIAHPNYGKRDVKSVRVMGNVNTGLNMTLSMSGDGMIEEVVAVGSYIPSTATAQQRDSSAVLNAIGAEQLARFGDSSAASALKRVAGVSVVGGQFAVVRGMQGRYISSTLNGSLMPSTDPMRRDVPLDLFPASVLGGIEIQKTFTPDLPGDSTGGAIRMKTKEMPTESSGKVSVSLGMNTRTTFEDYVSYKGGDLDWLGIDDGTREQPSYAENITNGGMDSPQFGCNFSFCRPLSEQIRLANSFENIYNLKTKTAAPDTGFSLALSDYNEKDFGGTGSYFALQYKNETDSRHKARLNDVSEVGSYERSQQKIDLTGYFVYGLDYGTNHYESKTILLRKTDDTVRFDKTVDDSAGYEVEKTLLQWVERQYIGQQFSGNHYVNLLGEDEVSWRVGFSQTSRYEPDRRYYEYGASEGADKLNLLGSVERRYSDLTEESLDFGLDYTSDITLGSGLFRFKTGVLVNQKDRTVDVARYENKSITTLDTTQSLEDLLSKEIIDAGIIQINGSTADTDDYDATDETLAAYVSGELDFGLVSVLAGARVEDFKQTLEYPGSSGSDSELSETKVLPVLSAVLRLTDDFQIRGGVSQTLSKPGLTERSESAQYDPETEKLMVGNPNLKISEILNVDLRAEYYFSEDESISLAAFYKDVTDPIERSVLDGSGSAADGYTFSNVPSATLQGLELDFRINAYSGDAWSSFVGGNFAYIDSEVDLSGTDAERLEGISKRQLQGQSKYLANIQLGFDHLPTGQSLTLLFNYFDDRIYAASRGQLASEVEDGRYSLDLAYQYDISETLNIKAKASNITDEKVSYSRNSTEIESYYNGANISASLEYFF